MLQCVNPDSGVRLGPNAWDTEVRVKPLSELMGTVLGNVSRDTGSLAALGPVWKQAVGDLAGRHTRPVRIDRGTLVVLCDGPAWRDVLLQEKAAVLQRLKTSLGESTVTGLVFEVE
jgi:hypothetical protein